MKLSTSVHNKVSEQKAGEVLGRVRERKEQEAAALSFAEQLEPKPSSGSLWHLARALPQGLQLEHLLHRVKAKHE